MLMKVSSGNNISWILLVFLSILYKNICRDVYYKTQSEELAQCVPNLLWNNYPKPPVGKYFPSDVSPEEKVFTLKAFGKL